MDPEHRPVRARDLRAPSDAPLVLGRYRLRRRLGTGGFATVWRAHDERLERQVAVKILPRERVIGGRFEREARAAARLAHPGIVTLYEAAVDDEGAYLVSELVYGTTLDELLADGRLSDRDVVQIGVVLCDALAHAHAQGVIHRDVKPSNVLVPERPTSPAQLARLTDFGVARVLGGDSLTRTGDVIGTDAYMAPEQAQGLPAGAVADLFSLALVLYEALSGTNPLRDTAGAARRRGAHLPPLRRQRRELPRELGRAIDLALRPRPSERGTLAELRAALVGSIARVGDEPGVVQDPWPARTLTRADGRGEAAPFEDDGQAREREPPRPGAAAPKRATDIPLPRRVLAGVAAAALAAYLQAHVPGASPLPGALTAVLAGAAVAVLPRAGWLILAALTAASLIVHSRPGAALVLVAAAMIPVLTAPRDGPAWPLAAGAPALNAIGLAAAWPALAGLSTKAYRRAVLAATGYVWTVLWTRAITTTTSLDGATHHVLAPLATTGTLIAATVWAAAALTLPLTYSPRWPALECLRLALWATALALGTLAAQHATGAIPVRTVVLGAGAGALVALVTRRSRTRLWAARSGNDLPTTS
jgi:tRNA A-37 threonylcarbamoyl transferase component Bud32